MLDKDFCSFLEYQLTKGFKFSADEAVRHFWCDGVVLPLNEKEYSIKSVNDNRKVKAIAYTGKTGQEKYDLIIQFGQKALSRYSRNLDIQECVPDVEANNWYSVDAGHKLITVQLL